MKREISVEVLRSILRLDAESGHLYWRERGRDMFTSDKRHRGWNTRYAGTAALTTVSKSGHLYGSIFHSPYLAHRVVFAIANGRWPQGQVDHKDGNPANNRPDNLREATPRQNRQNQRATWGTSPYRGVSWNKNTGKWRATISDSGGKHRTIGNFACEVEAARARDAAATRWHGEFACLNFPGGV